MINVAALIANAEDMQSLAAKYQAPDGVMELLDREYARLPELMRALAKAWTIFHANATDPVDGVPLPNTVMNALEQLAVVQAKCADVAERIVPLARKVCADKIDALGDKRNRMWDHRANEGNAA